MTSSFRDPRLGAHAGLRHRRRRPLATSVWRDKTHGTLLVPKKIRGGKEGGDSVVVTLEPREV